jgi:putative membrane protein
MSLLEKHLSPDGVAQVEAAIAGAETGTSGEIVPFVVERCDDYPDAFWAAAALGAVAAALTAGLIFQVLGLWGFWIVAWIAVPSLLGAGLAAGLAWVLPAFRRLLIPDGVLEERVRRRAEAAFLEEEVFDTRERTGILIFLALFEHRVVILGDTGINEKVRHDEWKSIVDDVAAGIRQGQATRALVEAIQACGRILAERKVERRPDDEDELSNELRMRRE